MSVSKKPSPESTNKPDEIIDSIAAKLSGPVSVAQWKAVTFWSKLTPALRKKYQQAPPHEFVNLVRDAVKEISNA
jgi:hypothetical protein